MGVLKGSVKIAKDQADLIIQSIKKKVVVNGVLL